MASMGRRYKAMTHAYARLFPQFVGRTLRVENNDVEATMKTMNRLIAQEGMAKQFKLAMRYEKPTLMRRRYAYEEAKALYDEDMDRKVKFVMKKNRMDPWLGST